MAAGPTPQSAGSPSRGEYYKIQDLASGGMAAVELSRVVDGPRKGELVAIKRLHPHLEREEQFAAMFFDEAWITAGLNHPNVVQIFDWGTDSIGRYLALEFVPGDSLLALVRDAKRANIEIPADLALFIVGKVAEGLHAAHELRNDEGQLRHLVHRDVTPSNVLVSIDGQVKLIDFGVAKARDRLSHTSTGAIKGKFGYMSPEQARGFPIDRRSDVFSLGVVLWEILASRRLYRSESELEILRMIVEDPTQPIRSLRPDVPEAVERLLDAALAKNRDDRLGSCGEFAEFIWAACHECGFTAAEPQLAEFMRRIMPERCAAIDALLAGANDSLSKLPPRSSSESFSGSRPVNHGAADAARGKKPDEEVITIFATSVDSPTTTPRSHTALVVAMLAVGGIALAAVAVLLLRPTRPATATAAVMRSAASIASPIAPAAPPPVATPVARVEPAAAPDLDSSGASTDPQPAHVAASHAGRGRSGGSRGTSASRSSGGSSGSSSSSSSNESTTSTAGAGSGSTSSGPGGSGSSASRPGRIGLDTTW